MDFDLIMRIYTIGMLTVVFGAFIFFEVILPLVPKSKKKEEPNENTCKIYTVPGNTITLQSSIIVNKDDLLLHNDEFNKNYIESRLTANFLNNKDFKDCLIIDRTNNFEENSVIFKAKLIVVKYPEDSKYE